MASLKRDLVLLAILSSGNGECSLLQAFLDPNRPWATLGFAGKLYISEGDPDRNFSQLRVLRI